MFIEIGKLHLILTIEVEHSENVNSFKEEIQISHPSFAPFKKVKVVAQILGTAEKIIKSGSTLQLHCILKRATEEPLYVFW